MKNKQMYVITMETGSYDSYNVSVVSITDDFQKGSNYVNNLNETYASMEKKVQVLNNEELPKWVNKNPRPVIAKVELNVIPKWKGDQKITKEMRDERKRLEEENARINKKCYEPFMEYSAKYNQFVNDWKKLNLTAEEYDLSEHKDDNRWDIEEVTWL